MGKIFIVFVLMYLVIGGRTGIAADLDTPHALKAKFQLQTVHWNIIKDSTSLLPITNFIELHKSGPIVDEAKIKLAHLKKLYRADIQKPVGQKTTFKDCEQCPVMVNIPLGSYAMGNISGDGNVDETPIHRVEISQPFAVGKYEVTFAEFDQCVADGGCEKYPHNAGRGRGGFPVFNVSWNDTKGYVAWLSNKTGQTYRLLSESEWEYVARAGTLTPQYWGEGDSCQYSNSADMTAKSYYSDLMTTNCHDGQIFAAQVGSFKPNAFGLYDVLGNVFEWTEDCWHPTFNGAPTDGSAWVSEGECQAHVLKGGAWYTMPQDLRVSFRLWLEANYTSDTYGFRVARNITKPNTAGLAESFDH